MRNIFGILTVLLVACLGMLAPASADEDSAKSAKEYQLKAVYLFNFVKYIEWPGAQALSQTHVANICIAGNDPFGAALDIFKRASSSQLTLEVKRDISDRDIPTCHILFVSHSEEGRAASLLAVARRYPILTVSEISDFADNGGVVEMVKSEKNIGLFSKGKINLRINLKLATNLGLHLDAQLLEIAAEVIK